MASSIQRRRGTTSDHATFTGAVGEITIDTTKDTVVVHDGAVVGGVPLLREDLGNLPAGAIDNADVNAAAAIAGTKISPNFGSQAIVTTGTNTAASFIPTSATIPSNGIYLPGANQVGVATNGTGKVLVDTNGTILVNTTIQATSNGGLSIENTGASTFTTPLALLNRGTTNNTGVSLSFRGLSAASAETDYAYLRMLATDTTSRHGRIEFWTANSGTVTEKLCITRDGLVGIGDSAPESLLHLKGSNAILKIESSVNTGYSGVEFDRAADDTLFAIYAYDSSHASQANNVQFYGYQNGNIQFITNSNATPRLTITSAGLVGIGDTLPGVRLSVLNGTDNSDVAVFSGGDRARGLKITTGAAGGNNDALVWLNAQNNAGQLAFSVNSNEAVRIDNSSRLLVGTSTSRSTYHAGDAPKFQVESLTAGATVGITLRIDNTNSSELYLAKARGSAVNSHTIVQNNDNLGILFFGGADGTNIIRAASVGAQVDGTATINAGSFVASRRYKIATVGTTDFTAIGASANTVGVIFTATGVGAGTGTATSEPYANSMPGRLVFSTTADGAASPTERMRITSGGLVGIGTTPSAWSSFTVLQVKNSSVASTGSDLNLMANAYYDGSNYRRIAGTAVGRQYFNTDGSIAWFQSGSGSADSTVTFSTPMTLDSSGRLLVGMTTNGNGALVQIKQENNLTSSTVTLNPAGGLTVQNATNTGNYGSGIWFNHGGLNSGIAGARNVTNNWGTDLRFYTHPDTVANVNDVTERMRITSGGLVGIGTTIPAASLDVSGGSIKLRNASSGTNYGYEVNVNHTNGVSQKMLTARYMIENQSGSYIDIAGINAEMENADYNVYGMSFRIGASLTERVRIDGSGRLLVGTSSAPTTGRGQYALQVIQGYASAPTNAGWLSIQRGQAASALTAGNSIGLISFCDNSGGAFAEIQCNADATPGTNDYPGQLVFSTTADGGNSPTERMRITSGGAVRIGSAISITPYDSLSSGTLSFEGSAGQLFSITNNLTTGSIFSVNDVSGIPSIDVNAAGTISLGAYGGNVGIGTSTPSSKLHVIGNLEVASANTDVFKIHRTGMAGPGLSSSIAFQVTQTNAQSATLASITAEFVSNWAGDLIFSTKPANGTPNNTVTEKMRITSDGSVLINATSTTGMATGSSVNPGTAIGGGVIQSQVNNNANQYWSKASGYTSGDYTAHWVNNTYVGGITTNGSSTSYVTSSDYRLKENVVPLTGAIDRINDLQVHRFNFIINPGHTVDGFLAHEAQAVVPECVTKTKDEVDEDGNPVYQGIDQSKLVPLLTAALQEAIAKIESLEARIISLEST